MAEQISRFGRKVPTDLVFEAWTSGDHRRMLAALDAPTNAIDRRHLLQSLVEHYYRLRAQSADALQKLLKYGELHLGEMDLLIPELRRDARARPGLKLDEADELPHIPTFDCLCMGYCEIGDFFKAREVWDRAVEVGYSSEEAMPYIDQLIAKRRKRLEKAAAKTA